MKQRQTVVTIVRTYDFEAAHRLPFVPDGHKCENWHGHSYKIEVHVTGPVRQRGHERGMVVDFGVIDDVWGRIYADIDHRPLNEVLTSNPTVEEMTPILHKRIRAALTERGLASLSVRVVMKEGPRSACVFPPYR